MNRYINLDTDTVFKMTDAIVRQKGDTIDIAFEEYEVVSVMWAGSYDYDVEVVPVRKRSQFIN